MESAPWNAYNTIYIGHILSDRRAISVRKAEGRGASARTPGARRDPGGPARTPGRGVGTPL